MMKRGGFGSIPREERAAVAWAFLYLFSILCGYYTLRPLRDEMGILGGVKNLKYQFLGTFLVMLAVVPVYSAVVAKFPRRKIIPVVHRFCAANLLAFLLLDRFHVSQVWTARVIFVWVSVFSVFVVSVFWSFMVDTFRVDQGKRLFGVIAAGGSAGALAGPALASVLAKPFGLAGLYVVTAILLEVGVFCVRRLVDWSRANETGGGTPRADRAVGGGVFAGFKLALASPYLLAICGMMLAYTISSTVLYADQAAIVNASIPNSADRIALFARIDLGVNALALVLQGIVTGWILTGLGLTVALCVLPTVTAAGFLGLFAVPGLAMLAVVQVVRRGTQYGLERPSREVLFTAVTSEEKYKAKSFIDTIVFRGGDAGAIAAYDWVKTLGPPAGAVSAAMLVLCGAWSALAVFSARRHAALTRVPRGASEVTT
ncbi:MAG TPA: MFS transporter [Candidatus Bathyarchaeia archaeon]|nr:MFS transporter [Candidatus Bathyarchaeia archaeon]